MDLDQFRKIPVDLGPNHHQRELTDSDESQPHQNENLEL
jgi:hypothetical protein